MKQGMLKHWADCACPARRALARLAGSLVRYTAAVYVITLSMSVSQYATAAAVTIDPSQVTVIAESSHNPSNETETIRSAVAIPGGGIFVTGIRDHDHLWSLKIGGDGSLIWKTIYSSPSLEQPFVAGISPDGGY
jgi:hypothetical protein